MSTCQVAILGAGPCGLSQLRSFMMIANRGDQPKIDVVCFEKQDDWGGMWNFTWQTGVDEYGDRVHGSMYRDLYSNGPKECIEYSDYSFDEHFKRPTESFPPREMLREYILARAEKYKLRQYIRFRHAVKNVVYDHVTEKFAVTVHKLSSGEMFIDEFDYIIIATGH